MPRPAAFAPPVVSTTAIAARASLAPTGIRRGALLAIALALTFGLAACGGSNTPVGSTAAVTPAAGASSSGAGSSTGSTSSGGTGAGATSSGGGSTSSSGTATAPLSLEDAAAQAYAYTLPLMALAADRKEAWDSRIQNPNVIIHRPTLADADSRSVTTPNNDTLYSSGWLLLANGPLIVTLPAAGERYYSLALMDFYSNNFAVRGTREDGGAGKQFWLAGPGWQGTVPPGFELIRSPTDEVWALGRTGVDGENDRAAALAVAVQLAAVPAPGTLPTTRPAASNAQAALDDPLAYFAQASALFAANPPPARDAAYLAAGPGRLGFAPGVPAFDANAFSAGEQAAIAAGAQRAYELARRPLTGESVQGWVYPARTLGDFGTDFAYRATVALGGLGALPNAEALYMFGAGDDGQSAYDGNRPHTLRFPPGQLPPAGAFWSLTLYERVENGNLFFYPNAQDRWAIGDRTPGLVHDADGGLTITLSHTDPGGAKSANWLPAPAGPFALVTRVYLPSQEALEGRYRLPAVRAE